eukprot:800461-Ditylum_brightwellii.AAC.1
MASGGNQNGDPPKSKVLRWLFPKEFTNQCIRTETQAINEGGRTGDRTIGKTSKGGVGHK